MAAPSATTSAAGEHGALRLLLVEDDTGIGRMLERGLAAEGYRVDWVRDLASATEAARGEVHDLVVLDRMLPDGDGAAFCRALRRFGSRAPVCMLTARDTLEDKLAGFDAGADDYLTKPFELDELLARLAALARRVPEQRLEPVLDREGRTLLLGPERVRFTPREWPLLVHLFDRPGETVSRKELIEEAWQRDGDVTENSVDVYVGYLRRKLGAANVPLRIETVRGEGYVLTR
ncbi:MAG: response regulator transcription factor [Pseudomonadota bacterium]